MALEIPPSHVKNFNDSMTIDQLKYLNVFIGENASGMNGEAWLNLIAQCNQILKIIRSKILTTKDEL